MLAIVKYPSAILKKRAAKVREITPVHLSLLEKMGAAMEKNDGVGLAAPQINVSEQIILVRDAKRARAFFNPTLLFESKKKEADEEGCLSLPGLFLSVNRSSSVRIACLTKEGKPVIVEAEGLAARIFQHEIDHLSGKLIIDRITPLQRWKARKQLDEIAKKGKTQDL